jgi:tryptophan-rich sensory protein
MKSYYLLIIFLVINFGALYIGGKLMGTGPTGNWYQNLNIAPWTPPGIVFGLAWTLIMITFSIYMKNVFIENQGSLSLLLILFSIQLVLNISWNYLFFNQHQVLLSLIVISSLLLLLVFMLFKFSSFFSINFWLLLPYVVWLCIATSLNAYVLINN